MLLTDCFSKYKLIHKSGIELTRFHCSMTNKLICYERLDAVE
jgi:hypothetical protein